MPLLNRLILPTYTQPIFSLVWLIFDLSRLNFQLVVFNCTVLGIFLQFTMYYWVAVNFLWKMYTLHKRHTSHVTKLFTLRRTSRITYLKWSPKIKRLNTLLFKISSIMSQTRGSRSARVNCTEKWQKAEGDMHWGMGWKQDYKIVFNNRWRCRL